MTSVTSKTQKQLAFAAGAVSVLILILSVKNSSIWIDEGQTYSVIHASWNEFLNSVLFRGDAVSGMPLFFLFEFLWCRIFGFGEFAMRSINLLMIPPLLIGAGKLLKSKDLPQWMVVFFAVNPVLLFYMNEARPYVATFVCGLWCFLFLLRGGEKGMSQRDAVWFFFCFWIGCALHMMFVFMGAAYLSVLIWMKYKGVLRFREHILVWAWWITAFLLLGAHYIRFMLNAPEVNAEKPVALQSILQIFYSFSGLSGLGWSRNALRCMDFDLTVRIVAGTSLYILSAMAVAVCCIRRKILLNPRVLLPTVCIASSLLLAIVSNIVLRTRFWERHVIYLLPGCILVVAMVCRELWLPPRMPAARTFSICLGALLIISGIDIIVMDYYMKDDYRGTAELSRSFNADHILFQGDAITFRYYGLEGAWAETEAKIEDEPLAGNVNISIASPDMMRVLARRLNGRSIVVLSEKDEFDKYGFYKRSSGMKDAVNLESFLIFPVDSIADDWLAKINIGSSPDDPAETAPENGESGL